MSLHDLPVIGIAIVIALAVWWAMDSGPLRNTRLAALDRGISDEVMALGADHRDGTAPTLYLVQFDQAAWESANMPAEVPAATIVEMLRFARGSGARVVLLDIDLGARQASIAKGVVEPKIGTALTDWEADARAPMLLLTNAAWSGRKRSFAMQALVGRMRRVAMVSTTLEVDEDNRARRGLGWDCGTGSGSRSPSSLLYLAARNAGLPLGTMKATVENAVNKACDTRGGTVAVAGAWIRASEPILYHLSGDAHVPNRQGGIAYASIDAAGVRQALSRAPEAACGTTRIWFAVSCDAIVVIGARHAGTGDKFGTPLELGKVLSEGTPFETQSPNQMDGVLVLGNWLRGYQLFGAARPMGTPGTILLLVVGVAFVFVMFKVWLLPGSKIRGFRRSRVPTRRLLSKVDWVFGPVIAKLVATAAWSFCLFLFFDSNLAWATGAGLLAASYAAAIVFAVHEVAAAVSKAGQRA